MEIKKGSKLARTIRFEAWKLFMKNVSVEETALNLDVHPGYVKNLYKRWKGTNRMDRIKENKKIFFKNPEEEKEKNILYKLSENASFSNSFVLITTDWKVQELYNKMINNRNTDLPL